MSNIKIYNPIQIGTALQVMRDSGIDYIGERINPNGGPDLPDNPVAAVTRFSKFEPPIISKLGFAELRAVGIEV